MEQVKVVVGVDAEHRYRPAIRLLRGLALPLDEVILAHSIEAPAPVASPADDSAQAQESPRNVYASEESLLREATAECEGMGRIVRRELLSGPAADAMIALADQEDADLIAVQSERKGAFRSFFLGSVSRGLAIASPRSLLISKGEREPNQPLRAVFATDHSKYSNATLDEFLRLHPTGIRSVKIVSAVAMGDYMFWAMHFDPYRSSEDRERRLRSEFEQRNAAIEERLRGVGYESSSIAPICSVNEALSQAMADADLLVMGAQGHGFVERLLIGSNSLHQVIIEPHPVLLLRPRD